MPNKSNFFIGDMRIYHKYLEMVSPKDIVFNFVDGSETLNEYLSYLKDQGRLSDWYSDEILNIMNAIPEDGSASVLINGQVQSGKTQFILGLISRAIDLRYDLVVFLGGTNNILLNQSEKRLSGLKHIFKENFIKTPAEFINISSDEIGNNTVILNILKGDDKLEDVVKTITKLKFKDEKILIIDDEADWGSVNYGKNNDSKVYSLISEIRGISTRSSYVAVTATPFANILAEKNLLYPESMINLKIDNSYCGNEKFLKEGNYIEYDAELENKEIKTDVLKTMLLRFFGASVNEEVNCKKEKHQLLINTDVMDFKHQETKDEVFKILRSDIVWKIGPSMLKEFGVKNKTTLSDKDFCKRMMRNWNTVVADESSVIILNGDNSIKDSKLNSRSFEIIIGGVMLSRGVTFENLTCELLLNMPKKGKISLDTLLQKARWFGYRGKAIKYMEMFMSSDAINCFNDYENILNIIKNNKEDGTILEKGDIADVKMKLSEYQKSNEKIVLSRKAK